ncbi:MAG: 30S ribosomal protein S6e [Halobacteria archaeon]
MTDVRVIVSDTESGDSHQVEADSTGLIGREIGEEVEGNKVGLSGYSLEITGGSDDTGRPMRRDVEGSGISEVLVRGGTGFNPTKDGERRRVSVRGSVIGDSVSQVNTKIVEKGDTEIEELVDGEE